MTEETVSKELEVPVNPADKTDIDAHKGYKKEENELFTPPEGYPKADPIPELIGNNGIKELLMAALCLFNAKDPRATAVPFIVAGKSGGGKSTLMESLHDMLGDDLSAIYSVDALTPAQVKGQAKGTGRKKRIVKYELKAVSMFDEINKWQKNYLEGVLIPAFGMERGTRVRDGVEMQTTWGALSIGTILPYWKDFHQGVTESTRVHNIEQILRRCIITQLEDEWDGDMLGTFIDSAAAEQFDNIRTNDDGESEINRERVELVLRQAWSIPKVEFSKKMDYKEAKLKLLELAPRIKFSERITYDKQFVRLIFKLSKGMAKRYGRHITTLDDVMRVVGIVEAHARSLGFLWDYCNSCHELVKPGLSKCPHCRCKMKPEEGTFR